MDADRPDEDSESGTAVLPLGVRPPARIAIVSGEIRARLRENFCQRRS